MFFPKTLTITGPTATGKTALAVKLARIFSGEIVSVDSRQVFRHMDLGTGKDLDEYGEIPYHMIDVTDPGADYDLYHFVKDAKRSIETIWQRGHLPILCGGSTLYLDALLRGYSLEGAKPDPELRKELDACPLAELNARLNALAPEDLLKFTEHDNPLRVRRAIEQTLAYGRIYPGKREGGLGENTLVLGVYFPRNTVHERIAARLDARLAHGMIDEVRALHEEYRVSWEALECYGLEYRWIAEYLQGKWDYADMRKELLAHIRQFAKRQDIWFRKMEREGIGIRWVSGGDWEQALNLVHAFLAGKPVPESEIRLSNIFYGAQQPNLRKQP